MAKNDYLPSDDNGKADLLDPFAAKLAKMLPSSRRWFSQFQAGRPTVQWTKGGANALELWADRGQGFAFLAIDTHPPYQDTALLPGASAAWK